MKDYTPEWGGPRLSATDVRPEGKYTCLDGVVNYTLRVGIVKVDDFGDGPFYVTLPKVPASDYILRNGGFFVNGGAHIPLALLVKKGEKKAFLSYTAPSLDDVPILPTRPTVMVAGATFFYSSGTYFTEETDD